MRVLLDHDTFSSAVSQHLSVPSVMDQPEHAAYRCIFELYFSSKRMQAFELVSRGIATKPIQVVSARKEVEFIADVIRQVLLTPCGLRTFHHETGNQPDATPGGSFQFGRPAKWAARTISKNVNKGVEKVRVAGSRGVGLAQLGKSAFLAAKTRLKRPIRPSPPVHGALARNNSPTRQKYRVMQLIPN